MMTVPAGCLATATASAGGLMVASDRGLGDDDGAGRRANDGVSRALAAIFAR